MKTTSRNLAAIAVALGCLTACVGDETHRIAIATFSHETCTFCPGGDSDIERWTRLRPPFTGDEIFEADPYIRGFVAGASQHRGIELIGLESPAGVFGGSSASWNTREAFDHFVDRMLDDLRSQLPVDGVYLALHGAMAVREIRVPRQRSRSDFEKWWGRRFRSSERSISTGMKTRSSSDGRTWLSSPSGIRIMTPITRATGRRGP